MAYGTGDPRCCTSTTGICQSLLVVVIFRTIRVLTPLGVVGLGFASVWRTGSRLPSNNGLDTGMLLIGSVQPHPSLVGSFTLVTALSVSGQPSARAKSSVSYRIVTTRPDGRKLIGVPETERTCESPHESTPKTLAYRCSRRYRIHRC